MVVIWRSCLVPLCILSWLDKAYIWSLLQLNMHEQEKVDCPYAGFQALSNTLGCQHLYLFLKRLWIPQITYKNKFSQNLFITHWVSDISGWGTLMSSHQSGHSLTSRVSSWQAVVSHIEPPDSAKLSVSKGHKLDSYNWGYISALLPNRDTSSLTSKDCITHFCK